MRVLLICEKQEPKALSVPHTLGGFQELVGGPIEVVEPFNDNVVLVCNENARCDGKPVNRIINEKLDVCGDFFLCGCSESNLTDLPEEKLFKYASLFRLVQGDQGEQVVSDRAWHQILS